MAKFGVLQLVQLHIELTYPNNNLKASSVTDGRAKVTTVVGAVKPAL